MSIVGRGSSAWSLVAILAIALGSVDARADASPTDVEAARAHYKRGVQLYEAGAYEAALAELQHANALAPTYRLLYNLALVQTRLGDLAGALRSFDDYLTGGGAEVPAARRAEVEKLVADLTARVPTLGVMTNVDGADVRVDGRSIGTSPLPTPIRLNPGPHQVTAMKDGLTSETREVTLSVGDRASIALRVAVAEPVRTPEPPVAPPPVVEPPPPVVAPPPAEAPKEASRPTWIGWTITGVLGAGAVATGIGALGESKRLQDELNAHATAASSIHSTHDTTVALAAVCDVLTVSTIAAGAVTLYFTLKPERARSETSGATVHVTPSGFAISGRF